MTLRIRSSFVLASAIALVVGLTGAPVHAATSRHAPVVQYVQQISREDVPPRLGSEPDTLVEPDIAVNPRNTAMAVAVAHDGRYANGGAVDIDSAWTGDGGRTWHHAPLPLLTKAVGGRWDRASDPVAAWGADGSVYVSALVFDVTCLGGVVVLRSADGGRTWSRPMLVHESRLCTVEDDKNWLVVDTSRSSPHFGRLYQFWSEFYLTPSGRTISAPQVLRWSDDRGRSWSATHLVTRRSQDTQGSQPMLRPDGTIVDAYYHEVPGREGPERPGATAGIAAGAAAPAGFRIVARESRDGGATWSGETVIARDFGFGPPDVRCCLPSATADPVTGALYLVYIAIGRGEPIKMAISRDGRHWSRPVAVTPAGASSVQHVNADVSAYDSKVFVSYGTRTVNRDRGRFVQQQLLSSGNAGRSFGPALALGPRSDLKYAAFAGAAFPGDYIGSAVFGNRLYLAWCRSSAPPQPSARYHQTLFAAVLTP